MSASKQQSARNPMWDFTLRFAKPEWRWYLGGLVFLAVTNYLTLKIPQFAKIIVNGLEAGENTPEMAATALSIVGLGVLLIFIRALSRIMIFWPGRKIEANSKSYFFNRLIRLPQSFYDNFGLGDLISRLANDIGHLRVFFAFALLQAFNLFFLLIFTISQMWRVHSDLTLACLSPLVLMLLIARFLNPIMYRFSRESQIAIAALTNRITESLVNVHVVQANAAEKPFLDKIQVDNESVYKTNMKVLIVRQIIWPLMTLLGGLAQVVVLFYGGYEVAKGQLTLGDIMAFNVYIGYLAFPLSALGIVLALYQRSRAALDRINVIEETEPEIDLAKIETETDLSKFDSNAPVLEIKSLSYKFDEKEKEKDENPSSEKELEPFEMKDISFTIEPKQHVGIFGGIGSGKTVLMDLISRLKEPDPGMIFVAGQDVTQISPHELRQYIGYGLQVPQLFSDSIRENLQIGLAPKASQKELEAVTDGAQVLSEVQNFQDGWDTTIGEKGVRLSGGQKQRLALARTFLRKPELLLLDDVLSAVDHTTERAMIRFISSYECSVLISSHRPSILKECDKVLIMEHGKIVAEGTYEELIKSYPQLGERNGAES